MPRPRCNKCGNPMPVIGDWRKNGRRNQPDWNGRKLCATCYKTDYDLWLIEEVVAQSKKERK